MAAKLSLGDEVHAVLPDGPHAGECRVAKIVRLVPKRGKVPESRTLQVLTAGVDVDGVGGVLIWDDSPEGLAAEPRSWHLAADCAKARKARGDRDEDHDAPPTP